MGKHYSKLLLKIAFIIFFSNQGFSQITSPDIGTALTDMLYISSKYVSPAASASVYQSSSSWYSSAESVGKFKVDVSLHFNILPITNKQKTFVINNDELINMEVRGSQSAEVPTALGGDTDTFFDFTIEDEAYEWQAFEGIKQSVVAHPYLQATVGLWKETNVTVRYSPKIAIETSSYEIFGGAIKHNVTQYFRNEEASKSPVEVAVLASYSVFNLDLNFDEVAIKPIDPESGTGALTTLNAIIIDADSWLFQVIASKKANNFEFSGAFGLTRNQFNYKLGGEEGLFLDLFNNLLTLLDERKTEIKGDIGVNYNFNKFYVSSMFTIGKFPNINLALHYKI